MSYAARRSTTVWIVSLVAIAVLAYATPWAAPLRHRVSPALPLLVVIFGTIAGVGQLVVALMQGFGKRSGWNDAAIPGALGASALCMALAFLPVEQDSAPHMLPLVLAAVLAVCAAVMQRRARIASSS